MQIDLVVIDGDGLETNKQSLNVMVYPAIMGEHSSKLKHLLWIIPLIIFIVIYSYVKRRCPE